MKITFAALVFAYIVRANALEFGSKSIENDPIDEHLPDSTCNIINLIGLLVNNGARQGTGVFISSNYFLTVAQNLFTKQENMPLQKINETCLQVIIPSPYDVSDTAIIPVEETYAVNVLRLDIHPDYNAELFLNDIALLLVTKYTQFELIPREFLINMPKEPVRSQTVDLYTFETIRTADMDYNALDGFTVDLVTHLHCTERFSGIFNQIDHICSVSEATPNEEIVAGSPLLEFNNLVGLFILGKGNQKEDALYINIFHHKQYIKKAKRRLKRKKGLLQAFKENISNLGAI